MFISIEARAEKPASIERLPRVEPSGRTLAVLPKAVALRGATIWWSSTRHEAEPQAFLLTFNRLGAVGCGSPHHPRLARINFGAVNRHPTFSQRSKPCSSHPVSERLRPISSVSYTHLDVYKRQTSTKLHNVLGVESPVFD